MPEISNRPLILLSILTIQMVAARKKIQQLSSTIRDLQAYIHQSAMNRLDERNRIAQEIHNKLDHYMTGALLQMQAAKRIIDPEQKQTLDLLKNAIQI